MNKLLEEQAKLQDKIDAKNGWEIERKLEIAGDALRLPDWDAEGRTSSPAARSAAWRCAACCCPSPTCCCSTSPPTTSTPNRWPGSSASSRNIRAPSSPSPTTATSSTTSPAGSSSSTAATASPGKATTPPGSNRRSSACKQEEKQQQKPHARRRSAELEWVRAEPKARQAKSKARLQRFEELCRRNSRTRNETNEIYIPPGERLGDLVIEINHLRKSFGDRLLIDDF
jgi:sulfate-transporting ATPase